MKKQYKVGDKVTIRSWESMEKEFGLDEHGDINKDPYFTDEMKQFCGKTLIIAQIDLEYGLICMKKYGGFYFIPEMFTDWEEKEEPVISECDCSDCRNRRKEISDKESKIQELREFLEKIMPEGYIGLSAEYGNGFDGALVEISDNAEEYYKTI